MDPLREGLRWLDRDLEEHGISYEERRRASDEFKDGFFRMEAIEEFGWLGRWMPMPTKNELNQGAHES